MDNKYTFGTAAAGMAAGLVNGLFGGGGGMVLIPILSLFHLQEEDTLFSSSVAIILPICLVSLAAAALSGEIPWQDAIYWLPGSALGGYLAAKFGNRIPVQWLHRGLGVLILYGGIRYLC